MQCRKIASNYLWTPDGFLRNPIVEVAPHGEILSVEVCDTPDGQPSTEFYAGILTPGFINAHCHLELSYLRGQIPEGCGFAGFASAMGGVRELFTVEQRLASISSFDASMREAGVVAVGDVSNGSTSFATKEGSSIHYHTFVEFFGLRSDSTEHLRPLLSHPHTSLTPHSVYSVQDAPFRAICGEGDSPLSIHFMESESELELFHGEGSLCAWYDKVGFECDFLHYESPAKRIVASIPASRRLILVHNCCVEGADIDQLHAHFHDSLFWCLCPRSNHYISRLHPPVELLRERGARLCIGTDSLASNDTLSILEELKMFADVPLVELLGWATQGGALALGLDYTLGTVEVGKCPGLNVISALDYDQMRLLPTSQVVRII